MPRKPQIFRVQKPDAPETARREYGLTQWAMGIASFEIDGNAVREASKRQEFLIPLCPESENEPSVMHKRTVFH